MVTLSAREFNQDVSAAKREAARGPVVFTDRGLLSIEDYRQLDMDGSDLVERLSMDDDDVDLDPEPLALGLRVPEL